MTDYDAIVFDNDGVLTTPTDRDALIEAGRAAFEEVGVTDPADDHVETLLGPTVDSLHRTADEHGVDPQDLWIARERAAIDAQLEEIRAGRKRLYDDVDVVDALETAKAIVSNNQHETIGNILDYFDLNGFNPWYGREPTIEGIDRKKPTPYYLELALEELGATNPLYVGDTWVDVEAADAAGIDSAYIWRDHAVGYEEWTAARPTHEIETLAAIPDLAGPATES
ncbi:HAD family hydrolase [Halosolutus gelatinilyticus]|uniref:HAD family hydrolase n=1 Tax=Halosolutus gelatinilyticus TaxID=2931975 RepID=UPI001FF5E432|nr:HAD-IA family hydrolase [Halosolutus gelatinilyticus]